VWAKVVIYWCRPSSRAAVKVDGNGTLKRADGQDLDDEKTVGSGHGLDVEVVRIVKMRVDLSPELWKESNLFIRKSWCLERGSIERDSIDCGGQSLVERETDDQECDICCNGYGERSFHEGLRMTPNASKLSDTRKRVRSSAGLGVKLVISKSHDEQPDSTQWTEHSVG
jgi:hypothetical protein